MMPTTATATATATAVVVVIITIINYIQGLHIFKVCSKILI
jgi:hypothetical protein